MHVNANDQSAADAETRFRALYDSRARAVLAYALRRTSNQADAEDVLIDTFTVCWRRLDDVPADDAALAWLYAVAARVLANQRRGDRRRLRLVERLKGDIAPSQREVGGSRSLVAEAMEQLRAEDAEILRLAAWEQLQPAEIAVVLGCSPNAAAVRLHRARRALRDAFGALKDRGEHLDTNDAMPCRGSDRHDEDDDR